MKEELLSWRLWVGTLGGDTMATSVGANCVAVAGERGTLVVDPLIAPAHARQVQDALERRGFPAVSHVLVTHHHTDHALGASFFAARGARVVATRPCAAAMAEQHPGLVAERRAVPALAALFADAEPHVPTEIFDDTTQIDLGGVVVEILRVGPAHTPGDAIAWIKEERAFVCGDLVSVGYHFNYEEADPAHLLPALDRIATRGDETFIPGHGPSGDVAIVHAQADYHRAVFAARHADEIRARFPGYLLDGALASAPVATKINGPRGPGAPSP